MELKLNDDKVRELIATYKRFPKIASNNMRLGMRKALLDVQGKARREHRFTTRTGQLEKAIKYEVKQGFPITGLIGINKKDAYYGKYVHDGTGPHIIIPRKKKALRFEIGGVPFVRTKVRHPGIKADPFLVSAFENSRFNIIRRFEEAIDNAVREANLG